MKIDSNIGEIDAMKIDAEEFDTETVVVEQPEEPGADGFVIGGAEDNGVVIGEPAVEPSVEPTVEIAADEVLTVGGVNEGGVVDGGVTGSGFNVRNKKPAGGNKPIYKKKWFIALVIVLVIAGGLKIKGAIADYQEYHNKLVWPNSKLANMLPEPASEYGKVSSDSEDYLSVYVYQYSQEDFQNYVNECKKEGFTRDYSGYEDSYSAKNKKNYSLSLYYNEETKSMDITLSPPEEKSADEDDLEYEEDTDTEDTSDDSNYDMSSEELREMLDEYEAFIDEYCDFLEKYNDSDDTTGMLTDYMSMLEKYEDFTEKLDDLDESDMSSEDYAYYMEVMTRCLERISEVQV